MQTRHYLITLIALAVGFGGGFLLANSLNRSEIDKAKAAVDAAKNTKPENQQDLSPEEIDAKIAEADSNPNNFNFQKGLGIALYRYGAMKQDVSVLEKSAALLKRANQLDGADNDVLVALGNAYFDIGYISKTNLPLEESRKFYETVLRSRPQDVELQTDLGLTYFLESPPRYGEAAAEFEKSLKIDPKHVKTLQFYVQTLAKKGDMAKAHETLERLRSVDPKNAALGELASMLTANQQEEPK